MSIATGNTLVERAEILYPIVSNNPFILQRIREVYRYHYLGEESERKILLLGKGSQHFCYWVGYAKDDTGSFELALKLSKYDYPINPFLGQMGAFDEKFEEGIEVPHFFLPVEWTNPDGKKIGGLLTQDVSNMDSLKVTQERGCNEFFEVVSDNGDIKRIYLDPKPFDCHPWDKGDKFLDYLVHISE